MIVGFYSESFLINNKRLDCKGNNLSTGLVGDKSRLFITGLLQAPASFEEK
jgi:hypothetical protein